MRQGMSPTAAAEDAMWRIYSGAGMFQGALLALDAAGRHGGAAAGWTFHYSVASGDSGGTVNVVEVRAMQFSAP
jgi:N4-(beta-N-acetylglucosaminyl)-L-asparaginase